MKNFILILLSILCCSTAFSQLQIYPGLDDIKDKEIVFVYRNSDKTNLDEFKKEISEAWTISDLTFVSYKEYKKTEYPKEQLVMSLYSVGYYAVTEGNIQDVKAPGYPHIYLTLRQPFLAKNSKEKVSGGFKLNFSLDPSEHRPIVNLYGTNENFDAQDYNKVEDYLYGNEFDIEDWTIGHLKHWIKEASDRLENGEEFSKYEAFQTDELSNLKTQTLYIAEEYLKGYKGLMQKRITLNAKDLMKGYKYEYKFVPMTEISKMITEGKDFYYMTYQYVRYRDTKTKYLGIRGSKRGERVAANWAPVQYSRLDKSDFKALNNLISKL